MNIYDALRQLERSIKDSPEYKKYHEMKAKIDENEERKEMLENIRKKQVEVQSFLMMGQEIPEEKMKELEQMNQLLSFQPVINDFLQAEYVLSKIFEDVSKSVGETFGFWLPEFSENKEEILEEELSNIDN